MLLAGAEEEPRGRSKSYSRRCHYSSGHSLSRICREEGGGEGECEGGAEQKWQENEKGELAHLFRANTIKFLDKTLATQHLTSQNDPQNDPLNDPEKRPKK